MNSKIVRKRHRIPSTHSKADQPVRSENLGGEIQGESEESQPTEPVENAGALDDFLVDPRWLHLSSSHWTTSTTLCAEGRNIPESTKILMLLGLLILIWTSCKKRRLTLTGMSTHASLCQVPGEVWRNLLYWKRHLQKDTCGPEGDWQSLKRLPDQIMYGQKFGRKLVKPLIIGKSRNGQKRSRSLTMLERWERLTSSIRMTKSIQKLSKMPEKNWKDRWLQPCPASGTNISLASWKRKNAENVHEEEFKTMYGCMVESHESTRQSRIFAIPHPWRSHCWERIHFYDTLQFGA